MRLLLAVPTYPHAGHLYSGVFNQRCAAALSELCEHLEVLSPRPYAPAALARLHARWTAYSLIPVYQEEGGIAVHRPSFLQIPWIASTFWMQEGAFLTLRRAVAEWHKRIAFDAILSFDLLGAGGLAWRLGRYLGIPAAGWATGGDIRTDPRGSAGQAVARTLRNLHVVFYQSTELFRIGAALMRPEGAGLDLQRHLVLSRGIVGPPLRDWQEVRSTVRARLGVGEDDKIVVTVGRIGAAKGTYDLLAAARLLPFTSERIRFLLIGATPGFDESVQVARTIATDATIRSSAQLVDACPPDDVWEYLAAADIFAFPSHAEGMPNSLLEAMAMNLPVVAFAIPAVAEIDNGSDSIVKISPFDVGAFATAIKRLAGAGDERRQRGAANGQIVKCRFLTRRNMAVAVKRLEECVSSARSRGACARVGTGNAPHAG